MTPSHDLQHWLFTDLCWLCVGFAVEFSRHAFVSVSSNTQLFSGTLFLFFGGCPTKNGFPQKGVPFCSRVTEQLSHASFQFFRILGPASNVRTARLF